MQPTNLANLIINLSYHLFSLLPSPQFPTPSSSSSHQDLTKEALNCLRVLGRVIVVVYENEAETKASNDAMGGVGEVAESFAAKYLWSRVPLDQVKLAIAESNGAQGVLSDQTGAEEEEVVRENGQFKLDDSDDEEEEDEISQGVRAFKATIGNPPETPSAGSHAIDDPLTRSQPDLQDTEREGVDEEENTLPCLVDRLFSCTIDLLFCAGFTVPDSVRGEDKLGDKINVSPVTPSAKRSVANGMMQYVIWEKGVGSTVNVGSSADLDRNKTELLSKSAIHPGLFAAFPLITLSTLQTSS